MSDAKSGPKNDTAGPDEFEFWIDPGDAPPEIVAEVLAALSELYRSHGGSGFDFDADGETVVVSPTEVAR